MSKKNREDFLETVRNIVCRDRESSYGEPENNFGSIARFWSAYLDMRITEQDVAVLMMLLKIARLKRTPEHEDSITDIAGYAACLYDVVEVNKAIQPYVEMSYQDV